MRQRFHVSWSPTFNDAVSAKQFALIEEPDTDFQIRRRRGDKFELVKRLSVAAAKQIVTTAGQYTKKKKKRKKGYSYQRD